MTVQKDRFGITSVQSATVKVCCVTRTIVNYNTISQIYDDVRQADVEIIHHFWQEAGLNAAKKVLDIGCGTANQTALLQQITQAQLYGLEPSEGMLRKARQKNTSIIFKQGDAQHIPFADDYFDFVYMTDVIHHVPDIDTMFSEIYRIVKPEGQVCIVTQSHRQIEQRPIVQFFPDTAMVDKARYPDIDQIVGAASTQLLSDQQCTVLFEHAEIYLDDHFLELVRKKGYSMLHLISDEAYQQGLMTLEAALQSGSIKAKSAGTTLVWFMK